MRRHAHGGGRSGTRRPRWLAPVAALLWAVVCPLAVAAESPESGSETVTLWVPARGGYLAAWREAARRAAAAHPDILVAIEPIWADYAARLTLALAEGSAPDLVAVPAALAARLAARGWLTPVDEIVRRHPPPPAALVPFTWEGRLYALPGVMDPVVLYVDAGALAEAGLSGEHLSTWATLLDAARRVQAVGRLPWATIVNGWPPLAMFVWQAGGTLLGPSGQPWDSPDAVAAAATFYHRFVAEGLSPSAPSSWAEPADLPFRRGEAALFMGSLSDPLELPGSPSPFRPGETPVGSRVAGRQVQVVPVPAGPAGSATWLSLEGVGMPRKARPAAGRALAYLAEALEAMGWQPSLAGRPAARAVATAALAHARAMPAHPAFLEFDAVWWQDVVVPLVQDRGPVDVESLLQRARRRLEQALQSMPR